MALLLETNTKIAKWNLIVFNPEKAANSGVFVHLYHVKLYPSELSTRNGLTCKERN